MKYKSYVSSSMYLSNLLMLLLFAISCSKPNYPDTENITFHNDFQSIDIRKPAAEKRLNDYLQIESILPLETSQEAAMKNIDKIFIYGDTIIVAQQESMTIKAFNKEGNYLFDIGKIGRGPGEFFYLSDVCLSSDGQSIWVNDLSGKKLINYSFGGNLINEIQRPIRIVDFAQVETNRWAIYLDYYADQDADEFNFVVTDENFNVVNGFFPIPYKIPSFKEFGHLVRSYDRGIIVNEAFSDTIYLLRDSELTAKYAVAFVDKRQEVRMDDDDKYWSVRRKEGALMKPIYEDQQILAFRYMYDQEMKAAFWHRKRKELLTDESFDNGDLLLHLFPPKGMTEDGLLIGAIVPGWFYTGYTKNQPGFLPFLKENYPQLYEATMRMEDLDNPYLVYYRIK